MSTSDVVIIGAGIVGAACADALARSGLSVRVIDARIGGATAAGMGHLVLMDDNPAELALSQASLAQWQALRPALQREAPDAAYTASGTLWVAANDAEMHEAERKHARLQALGVVCDLLDAAQLRRTEPLLAPQLCGALRVPGDAIVYAPNAAAWLLRRHGARIQVTQARAVRIDADGVHLADGSRLSAGATVLAAGLHAAALCPGLPLRAKKGQLAITDRYPGWLRHQVVELGYIHSAHHSEGTSVAFNLQPRPTGQLLIGSSRAFDTQDRQIDNALLARMLRRALRYAPALAQCNIIRTWAGFRAATPDGLPLIGAHPRLERLWLAVGHEGLGVTTAPATGQLIAAQITGSVPCIDPAPYAPTRLEWAA